MRTVWKHQIEYFHEITRTFEIPEGAKLVHVAPEVNNPGSLGVKVASLWFEVDTDQPLTRRTFTVYGTGHAMPDDGRHAGTICVPPLVLHVYERYVQ